MQTAEISLETRGSQVFDLTGEAAAFCRSLGDGLLSVFAPHATAGVALMELGSGSEPDLAEVLDRLLPRDDRYRHRHGSRGHGADHLLPVFVSPSLVVPVWAAAWPSAHGRASCWWTSTRTTRTGGCDSRSFQADW